MRLAGVVTASLAGGDDWEAIWERIVATTSCARGGKIAVCLAGGGTEGFFYELGVLRALQRFLPSYPLCEVDIVCGISAGAVLGALLANGITPGEIAAGFRGEPARLVPFRRRDLFDPAVGAFVRRATSLSWDLVRGRRGPVSAMFRLPPAGLFAGARLRKWLRTQLAQPGMTDSFEDLPHELFIGATDQDSSEHVVFGAPGAPVAPIHLAVRASAALAPFYAPERIAGRYYIDGGFTRTTNMRVAVEQGATLVILVDPLVPARGLRPGQIADRGGVFAAMQGLKTLVSGRFDKAVPTLRAMYPHVSFHLFQPGEDVLRVMGGSPMKYFYREVIEEIAFRETTRDIRTRRAVQLARDFGRHAIQFVDPDLRSEPDHEIVEARVVA
jgi:predicted acylesterase/phospholipase RssA